MAWTVTIYDPNLAQTIDISNRVLQINASEKLDAESNTFSVTCKLIDSVHKFNTITISKDGTVRYSGIILNQSDEHAGIKSTTFECMDWAYIFTVRVVAESYNIDDAYQGRPDLMLKNMVGKYATELTTNNVRQCNSTIDTLQFPYITLMEATKKVMELIPSWHWYVDPNKDVHLFENYESNGVTFTSSNIKFESLKVNYKGEKQANRIWIIGAKQASPNFVDQYYTGDGQQRYFTLAYEPNYTEIYVDGVLKNSKLESNDDGTQDFLINKKEKVFYIPSYVATPFTGTIKVRYRPTIQLIDYFENYPNILKYGLYEKVIKNKDITDRLSARQFGKAEIKRKSMDKRIISFITNEDVQIGQRCYVNIVVNNAQKGSWNITGYFLVMSVNTNITATESHTAIEFKSAELEEII